MANVHAVHSVGHSLATYLRSTYPDTLDGVSMPECDFASFACAQVGSPPDEDTRIALVLYRVSVSEHGRRPPPGQVSGALALDLHYLLAAFGGTAESEQVPMTWAMRQMHQHPLLDASSLAPDGGWRRDEALQIIPQELDIDALMRVWDGLDAAYRLSAAYVVRVVRIDPDAGADARPVVVRRLEYGREVER
jgi:hypothetical protein